LKGGFVLSNVQTALESKRISVKAFCSFMGFSEKTGYNKLNGFTEFTVPEALRLRNGLLPEYDFEFLFGEDDEIE
jgi:hypothetical protein